MKNSEHYQDKNNDKNTFKKGFLLNLHRKFVYMHGYIFSYACTSIVFDRCPPLQRIGDGYRSRGISPGRPCGAPFFRYDVRYDGL